MLGRIDMTIYVDRVEKVGWSSDCGDKLNSNICKEVDKR
jgi:hypothetical protein